LSSPCYETPKNAIKTIEQNNRGRNQKKTEETKAAFFMGPDVLFRKKSIYRVFELHLSRNAQKNAIKKSIKNKNNNKNKTEQVTK
jgi:hypothetical protein